MPENDGAQAYGRRTVLKTIGSAAAAAGLGGATAGLSSAQASTSLALDLPVQPLDQGHYEGWAIFGDEKVSTGKFSADEDMTFEVDRDLTEADKIAVTIEPEGDTDDTPSGIVYAVGELGGRTARLRFPTSFPADLSGTYILATPTNGADSDETAGVWFIDPEGGPSAGLADLPALPPGWTYEGWAVSAGRPITTGRFDDPASADDFDGHSGDQDGPPFPGEDLLRNAPGDLEFPADLADGMSKVVVSVEPDVDGTDPTGDAPFSIKPLVADVPDGLDDHTPAEMDANLGTVPDGIATVFEGSMSRERLRLDATFPELDQGYYQGWVAYGFDDDDDLVPTERFRSASDPVFEFDRDLREAKAILVTIEPEGSSVDQRSGITYLVGTVDSLSADLSYPSEFSGDTSGTYILATPTNGADSDEAAGVWFIDPEGGPSAGLADLPALPPGWTYEGWAVSAGRPITTGRFDDPASADDFDGHSGDQNGPLFPGEDLLRNAPDGADFPADLADGTSKVVVSVEPDVDGTDPTGAAPFSIKPLVADVPEDHDDHTPAELNPNLGTVPEGTARLMPATAGTVADYENGDGEVTTENLQRAIGDWAANEISTDLLQDVIQAWAGA